MFEIKETINKMLGKINILDDNQWRLIPVGQINLYSGATIPDGWLPCDGREISRTVYQELFAVIGTTYGTGNGSSTFNLPDFRNRMPIGAGNLYNLNSTGGNKDAIIPYHNHGCRQVDTTTNGTVLTENQIPSHTHPGLYWIYPDNQAYNVTLNGGNCAYHLSWTGVGGTTTGGAGANEKNMRVGKTGGSQAHNHTINVVSTATDYIGTSGNVTNANLPPYKGVNFIIFTGVLQSNIPAAVWQDLNARISNSVLNIPLVTNFTNQVNFSSPVNFTNQIIFGNSITVSNPTVFRDAINAVNRAGDTMTGELIVQSGGIWIQGGSAIGSNSNRMALTAGMPDKFPYNGNQRGVKLYSNAIAFADPLNGNTNNDAGWLRHIEETGNVGLLELAVGDDGSESIVARKYNTSSAVIAQADILDANHNSKFPGVVKEKGHQSLNGEYTEILIGDYTNRAKQMNSGLTTSSSTNDWLHAVIRAICQDYPGYSQTVFRGKLVPNSIVFFSICIYSTSTVSNYVPQYSFGHANQWHTSFYIFGHNNYSFSLRSI